MVVGYKCMSCGYSFRIQSERQITSCPYCGKKNLRTTSRDSGNADKLVREA